MPATGLKKIQLGKQAAWTTGVAATVRLMAVTDASLQVVDELLTPEELGNLSPTVSPVQVAQHIEGSITQQASYQDLVYLCHGVFGTVATSAAANTTYMWKYAAGAIAVNNPFLYTIEFGAPSAEYEVVGGILTGLEISGEAGGVWEVTTEVVGRNAAATTMTTALAIRNVDLIRMADTVMSVDTWTGTMGATAVPATLISFNCAASPQHHLKTFAGSLTPTGYGMGRWEGELTTVLEYNASAKAYVDALLSAKVQKQIQIKASQGATTTSRSAAIRFAGTLVDGVELFGDRDGNITVELTWRGTYHGTLASFLQMQMRTENGTLA